ncbi:hypothetical protein [Undibacterium terreum]|uniref:hypothetical protein n=1 Tax=Undibacterium terreum TaxID=1224302 RepID=UPI00166594DB|nr:hypothetical protein [Undibacterium terreum]
MISRRRLLLATAIATPLLRTPLALGSERLRFVFSRPYDNPRTQWLIKVYTEICANLGFGFEFIDVPPRRATALVLAGEADGELGRTFGFQSIYPKLVRVEEPNNAVNFCVYGANPSVKFVTMEDVRARGLRCECRRGITELETFLSEHLNAAQLSQAVEVWQGLKKLQLRRTDLYFDVQEAVQDYFYFRECSWALTDTPEIHELGLILSTTGHCYLSQPRAALAPRIASALKEMKHRGKVSTYLSDSLLAYKLRCR